MAGIRELEGDGMNAAASAGMEKSIVGWGKARKKILGSSGDGRWG